MAEPEIVGIGEIARRMNVTQQAVTAWVARDWPSNKRGADPIPVRPEPVELELRIKGNGVVEMAGVPTRGYRWDDVIAWAKATGRWTKELQRQETKRLSAPKPRLRLRSKRPGQ